MRKARPRRQACPLNPHCSLEHCCQLKLHPRAPLPCPRSLHSTDRRFGSRPANMSSELEQRAEHYLIKYLLPEGL